MHGADRISVSRNEFVKLFDVGAEMPPQNMGYMSFFFSFSVIVLKLDLEGISSLRYVHYYYLYSIAIGVVMIEEACLDTYIHSMYYYSLLAYFLQIYLKKNCPSVMNSSIWHSLC